MVEKFKENLGKDNGLFAYGLKDIESLVKTGACEFILISRTIWLKDIDRLEKLIKDAENTKTKVHVLDETNKEVELVLNSFGGIVSVLRYKIID
jgi:protein pelota